MNCGKWWADMTSCGLDEWFWALNPLCSIRLQLDLISLLVNFSCDLWQMMTRSDFLWARRVIPSNVRTDSNLTFGHLWSTFHVNSGKWWADMTSCGQDEWFWAMFKPTSIWHNFTCGKLLIWIGQIMTRYDYLWARWVILSNAQTDSNFT